MKIQSKIIIFCALWPEIAMGDTQSDRAAHINELANASIPQTSNDDILALPPLHSELQIEGCEMTILSGNQHPILGTYHTTIITSALNATSLDRGDDLLPYYFEAAQYRDGTPDNSGAISFKFRPPQGYYIFDGLPIGTKLRTIDIAKATETDTIDGVFYWIHGDVTKGNMHILTDNILSYQRDYCLATS